MSKKKILLLILFVATIVGGYILFFKQMPIITASANADVVVMADYKKIRNTVLWEKLTHTSKWSFGSSKKDSLTKFTSAFNWNDYVFVFHEKGQPLSIFYTILTIDNESAFKKYCKENDFIKNSDSLYINQERGITFFVNNNKVLVCTTTDQTYITPVANIMFVAKQYLPKSKIKQLTNEANTIAILIDKGTILKEDALLNIALKPNEIRLTGNITPVDKYLIKNQALPYNIDALANIAIAKPTEAMLAAMDTGFISKTNKLLNIDITKTILPTNSSYAFSLFKFIDKTDTAITYTYDDDFNQVEKKEIIKIREPQFELAINGIDAQSIFNNWKILGIIESQDNNLFTSIPFAKSYCTVTNDQLRIATKNSTTSAKSGNQKVVLLATVDLVNLKTDVQRYLPENYTYLFDFGKNFICTITQVDSKVAINLNLSLIESLF